MGFRVGRICTSAMQVVHKRIDVEIWQYQGSEVTVQFRQDVDYLKTPGKAFITIGSEQKMLPNVMLNLAPNERLFFFDENIINGLNNNIEVGEDLILFRGIKFHVVEKPYEALDDYVCVKGQQFGQEPGKNAVSKPAPIKSDAPSSIFGA